MEYYITERGKTQTGSEMANESSAVTAVFPSTVATAFPNPIGPRLAMISQCRESTSPGTTCFLNLAFLTPPKKTSFPFWSGSVRRRERLEDEDARHDMIFRKMAAELQLICGDTPDGIGILSGFARSDLVDHEERPAVRKDFLNFI